MAYKVCYISSKGGRKFKCSVAPECVGLLNDVNYVSSIVAALEGMEKPLSPSDTVSIYYGGTDNQNLCIYVPEERVDRSHKSTDGTQGISALMNNLSPFKPPSFQDVKSPPRKKLHVPNEGRNETLSDLDFSDILPLDDPGVSTNDSRYIEALNLFNEDYVEEHFCKKLSRVCFQGGATQSIENVVISSWVDSSRQSVFFELGSPAIAKWLIQKGSMTYDDREIVFLRCDSDLRTPPKQGSHPSLQCSADNERGALADGTNIKSSSDVNSVGTNELGVVDGNEHDLFVYARDIPAGSTPNEVTDFVTLLIHMNGLATKPGCPVTSCSVIGNSAKIKMRSLEERRGCLGLSAALKDSVVTFGTENTAEITPERPISSKPIHLESDAALVALLHALIKRRDDVMGPRIKADIMASILAELHAKEVMFTSEALLTRKRYLLRYYREKKKTGDSSWRFFNLVGQLTGDIEFNGEFADLKSPSDRVLFDHDATMTLILEYAKRKSLFERAHNARQLWDEIAAEVHKSNPTMGVSWDSCQRKWNTLKSTYYNFKHRLETSGEDAVVLEWPFYDTISLVLQDSVMAEPAYTFAVGAKTQEKKKKRQETKEATQTQETDAKREKKRGKGPSKFSNVARKLELEERKVNLQEKFLQLMSLKVLKTGGVSELAEACNSSDSE